MPLQGSSLLPASESLTPSQIAERAVLREAERGERLVAWARAGLLTTTLAFLTVTEGIPAWTGHAQRSGQGWLPILLAPSFVVAWTWLAVLARVPYRLAISRLSAVIDSVFVVGFMTAEIAIRRSPVAEITALGGVPPLMALGFMLAASSVRQDAWTCLLSGGVSFVGVAFVVIYAEHVVPLSSLPPGLAFYGTLGPWVGRTCIFAFTAATMGIAARNARRMARATGLAIAEQDKITQLFGRYVAPEIARDVMAREGTVAETLEVTVLFTDLRGFTSLSEHMEPADVLEALNDHMRAIVPVVHRHGGTVNKFIGDAIMVTFGAPLRHDDHARRAVAAAREMLTAMEQLNEQRKRLERPALRMGIGIATGPVVVGTLGTEDRVEYAVIGDTVNTASRLEGLSKDLGTTPIISAGTREAAGEGQQWRSLGNVPVKGKSESVPVWTVGSA